MYTFGQLTHPWLSALSRTGYRQFRLLAFCSWSIVADIVLAPGISSGVRCRSVLGAWREGLRASEGLVFIRRAVLSDCSDGRAILCQSSASRHITRLLVSLSPHSTRHTSSPPFVCGARVSRLLRSIKTAVGSRFHTRAPRALSLSCGRWGAVRVPLRASVRLGLTLCK